MQPVTPPPPSSVSGGSSSKTGKGKGGKRSIAGGGRVGAEEGGQGGGDAGAICDMQAWSCELAFENEKSCRLARKHMEGRRLLLRSEKVGVGIGVGVICLGCLEEGCNRGVGG